MPPDPLEAPSGSSYIIICNGRIAVLSTSEPIAKIKAASECAATLCSFIEATNDKVNIKDFLPISNLQHYLMDSMFTIGETELNLKIKDMFDLLDELEDNYSSTAKVKKEKEAPKK